MKFLELDEKVKFCSFWSFLQGLFYHFFQVWLILIVW